MKNIIFGLALVLATIGVTEAQSRAEKKQAKKELKAKEYEEVKEFFSKGEFGFIADWATTQKGRRIGLQSNGNSFVKKGDMASAQLPYFGVAQSAMMGGDVGISFDNAELEDQEVKYNDKKFRLLYSFRVKSSNGEMLSCKMSIQSIGTASLSISSTQRNRIAYDGKISSLSPEG